MARATQRGARTDCATRDTGAVLEEAQFTFALQGRAAMIAIIQGGGKMTKSANDWLITQDSTNNAPDVSYTYDQSGSQATVTRNGATTAYRWDLRNRMIGIDTNNDGVDKTSYGYDAGNQRIGQTTAGVTTSFLNDRNNPSGYP
jgi:YD repeat-containing protein